MADTLLRNPSGTLAQRLRERAAKSECDGGRASRAVVTEVSQCHQRCLSRPAGLG